MKEKLLYVLLGVLLATAAFETRDALRAFDHQNDRIAGIENYLGHFDAMMRGGR